MPYFSFSENCHHYPGEWESLLEHIKRDWPAETSAHLGDLSHQIEAKALHVITVVRHLIESAESLANSNNGRWEPVFLEAAILLFPVIDLLGEAMLGTQPDEYNWRRLASGINWLMAPLSLPSLQNGPANTLNSNTTRVVTLGAFMTTLPSGPTVSELFHFRNYLLHGIKNQSSRHFNIGAVQTSMNFEIPNAIVQQVKSGIKDYWNLLKSQNGSNPDNWVTRLAQANIHPLAIAGSGIYEKGMIDPDIVYWLSNKS
jgi:hypothetical protein